MTDLSTVHDKSNVLGQVLVQRERVAARLAHIQRVVAVMSGKGGVGKSALTANLAAALAMQGRAVGVLDADIHGASAAAMLGARGQRVMIGPDGARPAIGVADVRVMSMDLFLNDDDTPVTWRHSGGLAADTFVWRGTLEANALREFLADTDWGQLDYLFVDMPPGAEMAMDSPHAPPLKCFRNTWSPPGAAFISSKLAGRWLKLARMRLCSA